MTVVDDDNPATLAALDDAVRAHAATYMEPGDVAITWIALVGIRTVNDAGDNAGRVMPVFSDGSMPPWIAKGLLHEALDDFTAYAEEA